MNSTAALLCLLAIFGTACACPPGCKQRRNDKEPHYLLDLEQQNNSMAPWVLKDNVKRGRKPEIVAAVDCQRCNISGFKPEAIHVNLFFPEEHRHNGHVSLCMCPTKLAVGCACVPQ